MLIKSKQEIAVLKKGGRLLGKILFDLEKMCKPGVSTFEIDQAAEKAIENVGGRPAFKFYKNHPTEPPFPCTICASLNNEVVHGIAKADTILRNGDLFSIDIGMEWPFGDKKQKGLYTDTALSVIIGKTDKKTRQLVATTRQALEAGIKAIKPGVSLASVGAAIEKSIKSQGEYGIIRDLSGHGVGHAVHEDPWIPNYYEKRLENFILKPGMVLALEPMITLGDWRIKTSSDGWTVITADDSMAAHFEHTVVVTAKGCDVITRRPDEI